MGLGRLCATSEGRQLELCGESVLGEDVENGVKVAPGEEPTLDPLTLPSHTPEGQGGDNPPVPAHGDQPPGCKSSACVSSSSNPTTPPKEIGGRLLGGLRHGV